jgi:alkylation response protein AidB-like acyl-CoA dehydrogenase
VIAQVESGLTVEQEHTVDWLRGEVPALAGVARPGAGATWDRWRTLIRLAEADLARTRLAEGHLDAVAIMRELGRTVPTGRVLGVWAAEPQRLRADRNGDGWRLVGEKAWCSGGHGLDLALVTATASDGPRLFVVEPSRLDPVPGSWPSFAMAATASVTMTFDVEVGGSAAVGGPDAYVDRPGFWHGGAGVAACWFGGALGVAERLRVEATKKGGADLEAAWGRVGARLEVVGAALRGGAAAIDERPHDLGAARRRALRLRLVVEEVARSTIVESAIALGAGPLAHEPEHQRRVADLELYLRQLRPDRAAQELGALSREEPVPW